MITPRRVLVMRDLGLGDFCTAVPALRALRRHYREDFLQLVAPRWIAPLATAVGIDAVLSRREMVAMHRDRLDVAVNMHGSGPQSTRTLLRLRAPQLIAFRHPRVPGVIGPRWDDDEHEVNRWCRLVGSAGASASPAELDLPPPAVEPLVEPGGVVVHPGAASAARRWPADRFAQVVRFISERGQRVTLTGNADEASLAGEVASLAGVEVDVLAGRTNVLELCRTVADAAAVLSNDTGVAHVASAYRVPSVVLFGPTPPSRWGPPVHPRHRVIWKGTPGNPHGRTVDTGLRRIDVAEVVFALDEVISAVDGADCGGHVSVGWSGSPSDGRVTRRAMRSRGDR